MKKVKINEDGFVASPYIKDANIEVEVNDELYASLMTCQIGKNWKLQDGEFIIVDILEDKVIRERRNIECFGVIDNRSPLWFNHLSEDRKQELNVWYEAWLSATETKIIPEKLEWLE